MRAAADNSFARLLNPHEGAYTLSSTERLFRSITIVQCGLKPRSLEAGIETRPTLGYTYYQTTQPTSVPRQQGNYMILIIWY